VFGNDLIAADLVQIADLERGDLLRQHLGDVRPIAADANHDPVADLD